MRSVTVAEMVALEKKANASGLSYEDMMLNAGTSTAKIILKRYSGLQSRKVMGLVGSGNNGGDTLIALKVLQDHGWKATAYLVKERNGEDALVAELIRSGGSIVNHQHDESLDVLKKLVYTSDVILDGILGTGIKLPLRGHIPEILRTVNSNKGKSLVVAIDCPSGTDCDSGAIADVAIKADITVCMAAVKQGMIKKPAIGSMGEIILADIGLESALFSQIENGCEIAESSLVSSLLPERPFDGHKGTFGTCMVIGGSTQFCGAPILAAKAAYRIGAGLVRTAIPGAIYDTCAGQVLESTWMMLPHSLGVINADAAAVILSNLEKVKCVLLGPGMGHEKETQLFLQKLLAFDAKANEQTIGFTRKTEEGKKAAVEQPYFVLDADALRILTQVANWQKKIRKTAVLTPHPGEMAALTGRTISDIQDNRIKAAQEYAQEIGHVVTLKGANTVVADPDGNTTIIPIATASLATAGSGDVLAGMIAGLIVQGLTPYDAARAGCWLHGAAGLEAERIQGQSASVIASDVIAMIPTVLKRHTAR